MIAFILLRLNWAVFWWACVRVWLNPVGLIVFLSLLMLLIILAITGPRRPRYNEMLVNGTYITAVTSCGLVQGWVTLWHKYILCWLWIIAGLLIQCICDDLFLFARWNCVEVTRRKVIRHSPHTNLDFQWNKTRASIFRT